MRRVIAFPIFVGVILLAFATNAKSESLKPVPGVCQQAYAKGGWRTNPKIIKEGEEIYQERKYPK